MNRFGTKALKTPRVTFIDDDAPALRDGMIAALNRSQAVIEFELDGRILDANENFCRALGYGIEEIRGQHHSMFVDPSHRQSHEYRAFWEKLGRGEYDASQYKRIAKGGREIWIQASYNPILDTQGRPVRVRSTALAAFEIKVAHTA
ncbi:MAG: PAS domain-containing protein [Terricaulis sp.]